MQHKYISFLFLSIAFQFSIINTKTKKQDLGCKFFDLTLHKKINWKSLRIKKKCKRRSPIIQFYTSVNNIGNYLPVLGIQKMLGHKPDVWCIHSFVDFNFINKHYKCAIIGGAGLLANCFESFWQQIRDECNIPIIIWGIGICFPDKNKKAVDKKIISAIAQQCDLINVRDEFTAHYYDLKNVSITACPSIIYLQDLYEEKKSDNHALYAFHNGLESEEEHQTILKILQKKFPDLLVTNNIQAKKQGLTQIIKNYYCTSDIVITTRLHGAIIAYGLGIPYIIFARDEKLRSFYQKYKNGFLVENIQELQELINNLSSINLQQIEYEPVLAFGQQARAWVEEKIKI
ncbi:MAG: polysaccharide pyruvyl transferase family protein [Candidatus Babeliales bacterium]